MIYKQLYQTTDYSNMDVILENSNKNYEELKRIDSLQPEGSILYRYWTENHADGKIFYQVVKITKKKCIILACSGICLDEWAEGYYESTVEEATRKINSRIALDKLFSK